MISFNVSTGDLHATVLVQLKEMADYQKEHGCPFPTSNGITIHYIYTGRCRFEPHTNSLYLGTAHGCFGVPDLATWRRIQTAVQEFVNHRGYRPAVWHSNDALEVAQGIWCIWTAFALTPWRVVRSKNSTVLCPVCDGTGNIEWRKVKYPCPDHREPSATLGRWIVEDNFTYEVSPSTYYFRSQAVAEAERLNKFEEGNRDVTGR